MVCTDFSEASSLAVEEAYRMCRRLGAELSLVSVLEHDDLSEWPDAERDLALLSRERRQNLEALAAKLSAPNLPVRALFRDGHTISIILQTIQDERPDLVVLATHGKRGLDRLFLGSTSEAILRNAQCPVMTIGPGCGDASSRLGSGPIVCGTDFHGGAEESIAYAAFLSKQNQVPLHCVHVLPKTFVEGKNHIVAAIMERALASYQTIFGKDVSKALVEYAREVHASAIVLAVTRRSSIASHLPLRRTPRILILANCPVYTLAHPRFVSPLLGPMDS